MKKREQPKNGRKLLYIIMVLLGLVAGCAGPQLSSEQVTEINFICKDDATCIIEKTDAAMDALLVQLQYEAEDRKIKKLDDLVASLNACDASSNLVVVEIRKGGRSQLPNEREKRKARREYGYAYTHDNLGNNIQFSKILCMSPTEIFRQLNRY